jgi:hypothetical protein
VRVSKSKNCALPDTHTTRFYILLLLREKWYENLHDSEEGGETKKGKEE